MESPPGGLALTSIFFSSFLPNPTSLEARFPFSACQTRTSELRRSPGSRNRGQIARGRAPTGGRHRDVSRGGPTLVPGLRAAVHPASRGPAPALPRPPSPVSILPPGGPTSHSALSPGSREPAAGRPGARRAAVFIVLLRRSQGKPAPQVPPPAPAPAGLSSPERSVARGLPAFPGVRGGRPAGGCAHDGLDHGDVGGRLLDGVVPGLQGLDHRLRAGGGAASGGTRAARVGFTHPGAAAEGPGRAGQGPRGRLGLIRAAGPGLSGPGARRPGRGARRPAAAGSGEQPLPALRCWETQARGPTGGRGPTPPPPGRGAPPPPHPTGVRFPLPHPTPHPVPPPPPPPPAPGSPSPTPPPGSPSPTPPPPGLGAPPPPHLVDAFLQHRGVGQKLIVKPGLLHRLFGIIAEPQAVDDGLRSVGMGSARPSRQGAGRSGEGGWGSYQRRGRGDLGAPGGAHHHADLAVLTHDDRGAHGREWLFACSGGGGRGTQSPGSAAVGTPAHPPPRPCAPHLAR